MSGRRSIGRRKHQARYQSVYSKKGKIKEEEDDEYEDTSISVNCLFKYYKTLQEI
ncbi:hypothetical protein KM1_124710 [Entamoeba histolytica HM-3:IMSS]|uniref:Uncharacterized protein n=1 Tax=Entamoeba histolytica HM-3:IMSS TaxID=885315 RepID=M7WXD8_ENTHI|nr:hypothetical protein KM1_124710 [Entamoeba histolytica HM-3:IMSS]